KDRGASSRHGLHEKDVTLGIALTLGRMLEQRVGAQVIYTRDRDYFVPLEGRVRIANQNHADLFISIHNNASQNPRAYGTETYIYGRSATTKQAAELATRENAGEGKLNAVLDDMVASSYDKFSLMAAEEVVTKLNEALHLKKRKVPVPRVPFYVIKKTRMPSMLIEVAFITNPEEERKLRSAWWQADVAQAICEGIKNYKSEYEKIGRPQ